MHHKILLISANFCTDPYPVYPLGMALVARSLDNAGMTVRQFDPLLYEKWEDELKSIITEFVPTEVGISLRNIDNMDSHSAETNWWVESAKSIVDLVKSQIEAPIIIGGAGFSLLPEAILDYTGANYGIAGEGEELLLSLLNALGKKEVFPKISRSFAKPLQTHQFLYPLYDKSIADYHMGITGFLNFQTKRGCPFDCAYCSYPFLEGHDYRGLQPSEVVDNLERMVIESGIREVFFTDSIFNDHNGDYLLIAEEMVRRNINIRWSGYFRPAGMGIEEIRLLKRSGLFAMELGTDATSDTTLKALGKSFTFDDVRSLSNILVREEVRSAHFVIFGGPGETRTTIDEGLKNLTSLQKTIVFAYVGIRILPDTKIHEIALRDGAITPSSDLLKPIFYFSKDIDVDEMKSKITESFRGNRERLYPPDEVREKLMVIRRFGLKGILWDRLIDFRTKRSPSQIIS